MSSARTTSVDLSTPTKRQHIEQVLRRISTHIHRDGNTDEYVDILHPFAAQSSENAPPRNKALEDYAKNLRAVQQSHNARPWYMLHPQSPLRVAWDIMAFNLIVVQVVLTPVWIAFYSQDAKCNYLWLQSSLPLTVPVMGHTLGPGFNIFLIVTNYYFMVDLVLNAFTGKLIEDEHQVLVEWSIPKVMYYYLWHGFIFDLLACFPMDCVLLAISTSVNWYNFGKATRLLRIFTLTRRSHGSPLRFIDYIADKQQAFTYSARRLTLMVLLLLISMHAFACLLWFVIRVQDFPDPSDNSNLVVWPVKLDVVEGLVLLQWLWSLMSITSGMIGLGYGPFPPVTWPEAVVWVFAMLVLAAMFATLNGIIVATIFQGSLGSQRYKEMMDMVLEVLNSRQVPRELRNRVLDFFKFKYRDKKVPQEEKILKELPSSLRAEVSLSLTRDLLCKPPLSNILNDEVLLEHMAMKLHKAYALEGEDIVRQGYPASSMYFIRNGYVDICTSVAGQGEDLQPEVVDTLQAGELFGELALLRVPPKSKLKAGTDLPPGVIGKLFPLPFTAHAFTNCDMFVLRGTDFQELVKMFPKLEAKLEAVAIRYVERMWEAAASSGVNLHQLATRHASLVRLSVGNDSGAPAAEAPLETAPVGTSPRGPPSSPSPRGIVQGVSTSKHMAATPFAGGDGDGVSDDEDGKSG